MHPLLTEIHPDFVGKPLPLNRFLVHLRDRYIHLEKFHLRDEFDRRQFIFEVLSTILRARKAYDLPMPEEIQDYLNQEVDLRCQMTRLMLWVWRLEKGRFDLDSETDYGKFLFFYLAQMRGYFYWPEILFPDFLFERMNAVSPRFAGQDFPVSVYMDELWQARPYLHKKYDIHDPEDRLGFTIEFLLWQTAGKAFDPILGRLLPSWLSIHWDEAVGGTTRLQSMLTAIGDLARKTFGLSPQQQDALKGKTIRTLRIDHPGSAAKAGPPAIRHQLPDGVNLVGPYRSKSGLGHNVKMSDRALKLANIDYALAEFVINDATATARDTGPPPPDYRVKLLHIQPDNLPEYVAFSSVEKAPDEYWIGFFAWESDVQPDAHLLGIELVDEIWVPSDFVVDSFRTVTTRPVINVGHAIDLPAPDSLPDRAGLDLPEDAFILHFSFDLHSWVDRKNPNGAIQAFRKAFPGKENALLVIKARHGFNYKNISSNLRHSWEEVLELARQDPRIRILDWEMSFADTLGLIAVSDAYVSLHRSEGFGYTVAEAMALARPVIATAYSGSMEYTDPETAYLVRCTERFVRPGEYIFYKEGARWAEPDLDHAAELMRRVFEHPDEAKAKAAAAQRKIREQFSIERLSERYANRLAALGIRPRPAAAAG